MKQRIRTKRRPYPPALYTRRLRRLRFAAMALCNTFVARAEWTALVRISEPALRTLGTSVLR